MPRKIDGLESADFMPALVRRALAVDRRSGKKGKPDALPPKSVQVLEAVLYWGELPRGDVAQLLGASERTARRVTSVMIDHEVPNSEGSRAPLRFNFLATLASRWMAGMFLERAS